MTQIPEGPERSEVPTGWRCWWLRVDGFVSLHLQKRAREWADYATREEAEAEKARLRDRWGPDNIVTTVTPIYIRRKNQRRGAGPQDEV